MQRVSVSDYANTLFRIYLAYTREKGVGVLSPIVIKFVRAWAAAQDPPVPLPLESLLDNVDAGK